MKPDRIEFSVCIYINGTTLLVHVGTVIVHNVDKSTEYLSEVSNQEFKELSQVPSSPDIEEVLCKDQPVEPSAKVQISFKN